MKTTTSPSRRPGFTLIELLVVVSIIALLIAIMLPALGRAREATRDVACRSNLKQIAVASTAYAADTQDMPAATRTAGNARGYGGGLFPWHAVSTFGGKSSKPGEVTPEMIEAVAAHDRPLNRYILGGKPPIETTDDRVEMPLFQCPSDYAGDGNPFDQLFRVKSPDDSAYNVMGNSYGDIGGVALHDPKLIQPKHFDENEHARKNLLKHLSDKGDPSTTVYYAEIMFTYGYARRDVSGGRATPGFHGEEGMHRVAFFDGHVNVVEQTRDMLRRRSMYSNRMRLKPIQCGESWSLYTNPRPYPLN